MNSRLKQFKGAYVVTEPGCLEISSGAYKHIQIGVQELQKYFALHTNFPEHLIHLQRQVSNGKSSANTKKNQTSYIHGTLIDLKTFLKATLRSLQLVHKLSKQDLDFVYFRASFLDPLPLFLDFLNIPCFIEANGLQVEDRKQYYPSLLTGFNKWFERLTYSKSKHVFFIGTYGNYWELSSNNWSNVENGVESSFLATFSNHKKQVDGKVHFAFVGRLMSHHRYQVLVSAVQNLPSEIKSKICFHLIGSKLKIICEELKDHVETIEHGFLDRSDLSETLQQVHVGVISGHPEYASAMKLFDYGAAKCLVLVPETHNFKCWFRTSEIEFFEPEDSSDLGSLIKKIVLKPHKYIFKGENLHQKILRMHTWEKTFSDKSELIEKYLSLHLEK